MDEIFRNWLSLRSLRVDQLPENGEVAAVYALRDGRTGGVLKFGNTNCLRRRIFGNYLGGVGGATTQRVHRELFDSEMIDHVEIAWSQTADKAQAEAEEKRLRQGYKLDKRRRLPWDLIG